MPVLTKINTNSIAEDAITGDKFAGDAYLSNTANQNISGTYSENRLYTSDAYTLSGNATVNSELVLSSVKPTADVVLTAGGAYTITGTGVLSGGTLLAQGIPQRTSLTGMTGELGSTVTGTPAITGSPALNISNVTGSIPSAVIPYGQGSSAAGSQNIGGIRYQWGNGTLPASGSDVGSGTYGTANRYYQVIRVDYDGFSEAPHLYFAGQGNGYHETKIANYESVHGHASGDYFNFIITSSRTAGFVNTAYKWLIIGKAA